MLALETCRNGERTCKWDSQYIHSSYSPTKEVEKFFKSMTVPDSTKLILIIGESLGFLSDFLRKHYKQKIIQVFLHKDYVSHCTVLEQNYWYPDASTPVRGSFRSFLQKVVKEDFTTVHIIQWKASILAHSKVYKKVAEVLSIVSTRQLMSQKTEQHFSSRWKKNFFFNSSFFPRFHGVVSFPETVLILASGPSLNHHITELRDLSKRIPVIALPSSLAFSLKYDIQLAAVISTDGGYYASAHLHLLSSFRSDLPLFMSLSGAKGCEHLNNPIVPFLQQDSFETEFVEPTITGFPEIPSCGTVAGSALFLCLYFGCHNIIFAGLDFCVQRNQLHCSPHTFDSLYFDGSSKTNNIQHKFISKYQDYEQTGRECFTNDALKTYANWFSETAKKINRPIFRLWPSAYSLNGVSTINNEKELFAPTKKLEILSAKLEYPILSKKGTFEKNLHYLLKNNAEIIGPLKRAQPTGRISIKLSKNAVRVPVYSAQGNEKTFHSLFDPLKEASKVSPPQREISGQIIFGLGAGYHIDVNNNHGVSVNIIQPNIEHTRFLLENFDYSKIFSNHNYSLIIPEINFSKLQTMLETTIPFFHGIPHVVFLQGAKNIYRPEAEKIDRFLQNYRESALSDTQTQGAFGKIWTRNILINSFYSSKYEILPKSTDFPEATIFLAGPSLGPHLKNHQNIVHNSFVISSDTACNTLLKHTISPSVVCTLDSQFYSCHHFYNAYRQNLKVVTDNSIHPAISRTYDSQFLPGQHPMDILLNSSKSRTNNTGPAPINVAELCFSLAKLLRFKVIHIFGSDFCYTSGTIYCENSYQYKYFFYNSSKINSVESSQVQFLSRRKANFVRTGNNEVYYKTELMDAYASHLRSTMQQHGYTIHLQEHGYMKAIANEQYNTPSKSSHNKEPAIRALRSYRKNLKKISPDRIDQYLLTLVPFAQHFRKNNPTETIQASLNKAQAYTINLIDKILENQAPDYLEDDPTIADK